MNLVKKLIADFRYTPEQIAYRIGVSYRQVLRWRDGETKMPLRAHREKLEKIVKQEEEKGGEK